MPTPGEHTFLSDNDSPNSMPTCVTSPSAVPTATRWPKTGKQPYGSISKSIAAGIAWGRYTGWRRGIRPRARLKRCDAVLRREQSGFATRAVAGTGTESVGTVARQVQRIFLGILEHEHEP